MKGADQPAYPHGLISVLFIFCCQDGIVLVVATSLIPRCLQASVAEQASLSPTWFHNTEGRFSHDVAQIKAAKSRYSC